MDKENAMAFLHKPDGSAQPKEFTYDAVYDETSTQKEIYDETASGIVDSVMEGYNGKSQSLIVSFCHTTGVVFLPCLPF